MYVMTNTTQFHPTNLKLFSTHSSSYFFASSSNLKSSKPTSSKSPFSRPLVLKRNASPNLLRTQTMFELAKASAFRNGNNGDEAIKTLEQEAFVDGSSEFRSGPPTTRIESILNRLSKWVISGLFAGVILWRHDGEAVWAAMGSIVNAILSVVLKQIINQQRPASAMKSDPGMPSSHAQSIFFTVTFSILSIVEGLGINDLTLAGSGVALALGSYLSWLRVSQRLHTVSQVVVGAIVGLIFSILWYWSWNAFVFTAFVSSLWVRIVVVSVAAGFGLGFVIYVYKNWLKDD